MAASSGAAGLRSQEGSECVLRLASGGSWCAGGDLSLVPEKRWSVGGLDGFAGPERGLHSGPDHPAPRRVGLLDLPTEGGDHQTVGGAGHGHVERGCAPAGSGHRARRGPHGRGAILAPARPDRRHRAAAAGHRQERRVLARIRLAAIENDDDRRFESLRAVDRHDTDLVRGRIEVALHRMAGFRAEIAFEKPPRDGASSPPSACAAAERKTSMASPPRPRAGKRASPVHPSARAGGRRSRTARAPRPARSSCRGHRGARAASVSPRPACRRGHPAGSLPSPGGRRGGPDRHRSGRRVASSARWRA